MSEHADFASAKCNEFTTSQVYRRRRKEKCENEGEDIIKAYEAANLKHLMLLILSFMPLSASLLMPGHDTVRLWPLQLASAYTAHRSVREVGYMDEILSFQYRARL